MDTMSYQMRHRIHSSGTFLAKSRCDIVSTKADIVYIRVDTMSYLVRHRVHQWHDVACTRCRTFLREVASEISYPLTNLFNTTISQGKIPRAWKIAEVRPIFKKGDKTSPGNYRPVSLTAITCKLFETFIRDLLYNHLVENELYLTINLDSARVGPAFHSYLLLYRTG